MLTPLQEMNLLALPADLQAAVRKAVDANDDGAALRSLFAEHLEVRWLLGSHKKWPEFLRFWRPIKDRVPDDLEGL
jgi:hypothetical protein